MGSLGDAFGGNAKEKLFQAGLTKGDIFLNQFEGIDHPKFFIIAGIAADKIFTCAVYINSEIHPSLFRKQELLELQIPIKKANYPFLKYDSFVCCSTTLYINSTNIFNWIENKSYKVIDKLTTNDLTTITNTIINSGLLTEEEIELYFTL